MDGLWHDFPNIAPPRLRIAIQAAGELQLAGRG